MHAPPGARLEMRIAAFAWVVKNKLRPLGAAVLGGPCQLMGTGMAFPWPMLRDAPLATGHLVEDMQLGLDLARAGTPPLFCPAAGVSSVFPLDRAAARTQRTRWEHGHLSMLAGVGPRLLALGAGARPAGADGDGARSDGAAARRAGAAARRAGARRCGAGGWWAGDPAPFVVALVRPAARRRGGAGGVVARRSAADRLRELLGLPLYIAAKLPVYLRLLGKRQVEWVRTKRDDAGR